MHNEIEYREDCGMWWPKFDRKPLSTQHAVKSGIGAVEVLVSFCKRLDTCVQAGGHMGFWPIKLAKTFKHVHTFEADPIIHKCLELNVEKYIGTGHDPKRNVYVKHKALGDSDKPVLMRRSSSAGGTRVKEGGTLQIPQITIDSLNLDLCDAIILDIEAYEPAALRGAAKTIQKFKPVILVEELPRVAVEIAGLLTSWGYRRQVKYGRDGIWRI